MPQFTRVFRNFEKLFPGSLLSGPSHVRPDLALVMDVMKPGFLHDSRLSSDVQTAATGGADTTFDLPEPDAGFVHLPVAWIVTYDGALNRSAGAQLKATSTTPLDPWGRWSTANIGIGTTRLADNLEIFIPTFPYSRGSQLSVTVFSPVAGTNFASRYFFLSVPGELVNVEQWAVRFGNFVHTRALP